ncbi:MAG: SPASM domain-containing protein [Theionarchaea archaeon]|nr:SPASM domain-containing protein [Theionarchaea archaeon]MBU7041750.1 SPASM domain-containing protein [Theionarchaea archaeon]
MTEQHRFEFLGSDVVFDPAVVEPPSFIERDFPVTSLALDVSGTCNMNCIYCAESSTMPQRAVISNTILEKALDSFFSWSSGVLSIHVGSGEPLLNPSAVRTIGRRAREYEASTESTRISLHLTTNGTAFTGEVVNWLREDNWVIKISLDGNSRIHNHNRKDRQGRGTYERIENYVRALCDIPSFSTTSVLCHETDPAEVFYAISALGVQNIELVPVAVEYPSNLSLDEEDILNYKRFVAEYVKRIAEGESMPRLIRFMKKLQRVLGFGISRVPCGAGRNFLAVGPHGEFYPCFRFVGLDQYRLGDLTHGIGRERTREFALTAGRPYDARETCGKCWAAPLCGGPCFACSQLLFYRNGEPSPDYCGLVRADCEAAVWLAQTLRDEAPERLVELAGIHLGDL